MELWAKIGVEFLYKSQIFCTACMARCQSFSHRCSCSPSPRLVHSELILFPLEEELRRVVRMNIDLIDRYHPHNSADVIHGEFSLTDARKPCSILGDVYRAKRRRNPLTLLLGTDGKPTINSSRSSVWPVISIHVSLLIIVDFFSGDRYNCRNPTASPRI